MASSLICPLIENDHCVAYAVRPLACRGHASYDEEACRDALKGGASEVPVSALHLTVRSLVQNSMQSALRDTLRGGTTNSIKHFTSLFATKRPSEIGWQGLTCLHQL
jgi:hypothetical protein